MSTTEAKESATAKSTGPQDEDDMSMPDTAFLRVLNTKNKISKDQANYLENAASDRACVKCKFNLGDEEKCHIV